MTQPAQGNGRGRRLRINGMVQGVGFRPRVYTLAQQYGLTGSVANTPAGVVVEIWGPEPALDGFVRDLTGHPPPLARIDSLEQESLAGAAPPSFVIRPSASQGEKRTLVPPDAALCAACRREMADAGDRRFRYPFITCTDCGPRYTVIRDLPYDRPATTMAPFALCPRCREEYENPGGRRFHAETTCCPACGPRLWLVDHQGRPVAGEPLAATVALLQDGATVAVKGLGGFHLAVNARDQEAVARLRRFKQRPDKPFAVMARDLAVVHAICRCDPQAESLLTGRESPIVLLEALPDADLAPAVAPGNRFVGVMLPYTPLHQLLLAAMPLLVMTSANRSGEPIVKDNDEARAKLADIADAFLCHDREIVTRIDDSVVRPDTEGVIVLRRARGYAPLPLELPWDCGRTLAVGGMLKNTVCLTRGNQAFVSQHLGDLDLLATQENFTAVIAHLEHLLQTQPERIACDLHPDYPSTRYALEQSGLPAIAVQHHHAHAVSVMAEHGLAGPVLAVTLDGSGYGPDDTIWGGEILLAQRHRYQRLARLRPVPLPGGEAAIRQPWRMAVSLLLSAGIDPAALPALAGLGDKLAAVAAVVASGLSAPLTSSCGRLFDGVAAMAGIRLAVSYEGQAAMELEMAAMDVTDAEPYPLPLEETGGDPPWTLDLRPLVCRVAEDLAAGVAPALVAARFHRGLAAGVADGCAVLARRTGVTTVVLSGGCLQNRILTGLLCSLLAGHSLTPLTHRQLPPNDGCLSLGQAVAGAAMGG